MSGGFKRTILIHTNADTDMPRDSSQHMFEKELPPFILSLSFRTSSRTKVKAGVDKGYVYACICICMCVCVLCVHV